MQRREGAVLALNAGSSSLKYGIYRLKGSDREPERVRKGAIETGDFRSTDAWKKATADVIANVEQELGGVPLVAVGHRVVHGGMRFAEPVHLSEQVIDQLEQLTPLAPLHQPRSLNPIRAIQSARPDLAQTASFDTSFHRTMPATMRRMPLPRSLEGRGIRRYGFHGLSFQYLSEQLSAGAGTQSFPRTVLAHLGSGASLCALSHGKSIDTTMGFSALDGLMMGTRCGSLDPGVVLHLLSEGMSAAELQELLYEKSGLRGVSELSADLRRLLQSSDLRAEEAIDLFVHRAVQSVAAMVASLGGLDRIVFTAGIGEHAWPIRARICERLAWLGVKLDDVANQANERIISEAGTAVQVLVIPTDEEAVIARNTARLILA